jgi:hypothetical protein
MAWLGIAAAIGAVILGGVAILRRFGPRGGPDPQPRRVRRRYRIGRLH